MGSGFAVAAAETGEICECRSGGDVREFYSRYCLSLTPSVCVITLAPWRLFHLIHTHTLTHTDTHIHTDTTHTQEGRPGAGVCPCQNKKKVTGAPVGNLKIKRPSLLLYIPCLCLLWYNSPPSGSHFQCNLQPEKTFWHDKQSSTALFCISFFFPLYVFKLVQFC